MGRPSFPLNAQDTCGQVFLTSCPTFAQVADNAWMMKHAFAFGAKTALVVVPFSESFILRPLVGCLWGHLVESLSASDASSGGSANAIQPIC